MGNTSASNRRLPPSLFIGASSRGSIAGALAASGLGWAMNLFIGLAADSVVATEHVVNGGVGEVASAGIVAGDAGVGFIPGDAVGEAIVDSGASRGGAAKPGVGPESRGGGQVSKVAGIGLSTVKSVGSLEVVLELGPSFLSRRLEAPSAAGFRVDAGLFKDGEGGAGHVGDGDLIIGCGETTEGFLAGPKASKRNAGVPWFLEFGGIFNEFIISDGGMFSNHVLQEDTGADIGIPHDGMFKTGVVGLVDMVQEEGTKIIAGRVKLGVFSQSCSVDMASFSNVSRGGIGWDCGKRAWINRIKPRGSSRHGSKLGSRHESTNETSGASTTMGRVSGGSSIELGLQEADCSSTRFFFANGVHEVIGSGANVSHGE